MIKLFLRDISPLYEGEWEKHLELLPPKRREAVMRFRHDGDRARSVGAWLLLREAFEGEGREAVLLTDPEKNEYGKPFFAGGPEFSISHAGPYAAAAVSDRPVGVDIEAPRCTMRMAEHFFADSEVEAARALSGEERRLFLLRVWVAKEAFIKMLGTGLSTPLDSFRVMPEEGGIRLDQDLTPLEARITDHPVGDHRVAVAGVGEVEIATEKKCCKTQSFRVE